MPTKKPTKASVPKDEKKKSKPDFVCTTNTTPDSVVDAKVAKQVSVTYRFFPAHFTGLIFRPEGEHVSADSKKLTALPIVIGYVKNDSIESCTGSKIRRMPEPTQISIQPKGKDLNPKKPRGAIKVQCHILPIKNVSAGKALGLYLGSDTKNMFREHVLYKVTPGDNDVVVDVYETYGKHGGDDTIKLVETKKENDIEVDYYQAKLTGDIWKKISHTYDEDDVDDMTDIKLPDEAVAAIKKIYNGEVGDKSGRLALDITFSNKKTLKLIWGGGAENALNNISSLDIKTELLNRVQPSTYGALLKAAIDAEVGEVTISSGWRPMVGSVIHRLGLGLDVTYVKYSGQSHHMNRQWGRGNENLTQDEKDAYKDVEDKKKALEDAKRAKKSKKEIKALADELKTANEKLTEEIKSAPATTDPKPLKDFRKTLLNLNKVKQVFDPWYIDKDGGDKIDPEVNALGHDSKKSKEEISLEKLHAHHLHITVTDVELGVVRSKQ